jgi:hypothetical protein
MSVLRHFWGYQSVILLAAGLTDNIPISHVNRCFSLQVWQGKVGGSIAAISGAQQAEKRLVLVDWQQLAIAKGPTLWWKIEAKNPDLR